MTILGPPKLAVTRFLAFGNSLTAGPTVEGYRLITEELERVLVARYDVEIGLAAEQPGDTLAASLPTDQDRCLT